MGCHASTRSPAQEIDVTTALSHVPAQLDGASASMFLYSERVVERVAAAGTECAASLAAVVEALADSRRR